MWLGVVSKRYSRVNRASETARSAALQLTSTARSGRDSLARFSTSCPDAVDSDTSYRFESHEAVVAMLRWQQDTSRRLPAGADRRRPPGPPVQPGFPQSPSSLMNFNRQFPAPDPKPTP